MLFIKKYSFILLEIIFFTAIFFLSIRPLQDFDLWFHLKSGEIISKMGIIHHDVFAFTTKGREWFPYEWLFQVFIYRFKEVFGLDSIKYLVAFINTLVVLIIYHILKQVVKLHTLVTALICFFFFVLVYGELTARPHLFAYTFFLINLFFILNYFFKGKNLLLITLPITYAWTNLHASVFLNLLLFLGFAATSFLYFLIFKQKGWFAKSKTLAIYTVINLLLTILPPLGFLQYRLLYKFFFERELLSRAIDEWAPLYANPFHFTLFLSIALLIALLFIVVTQSQKIWKEALWVLPLIPLPYSAFLASRNFFLGLVSLTLILGWSLSKIRFSKSKIGVSKFVGLYRAFFWVLILAVLTLHIWIIYQKKTEEQPAFAYYPVQATKFIKTYKLAGNMFNEYGYGGYLLYQLYPDQKVYIDGRTDLYLCCELPDILGLAQKKFLPDDQYKNVQDALWYKNNISFVLLRTEKHTVIRKMAKILQDDPNWSLVFWDDVSQIFVRIDGKNASLIEKFGTVSATPYLREPFREGQAPKALIEYQRMIQVADSAKSRNAIGFIYLQKDQFDLAKDEFEKAIKINPLLESPYMNLAELAAKNGNTQETISLYKKAQKLAPDRGLIYIRLGQIYAQTGNIGQARKVWQEGLRNTVDDDAKIKLKEFLSI